MLEASVILPETDVKPVMDSSEGVAANPCNAVIPLPENIVAMPGVFKLKATTPIIASEGAETTGELFAKGVQTQLGLTLKIKSPDTGSGIFFRLDPHFSLGDEAYEIAVSLDKIIVTASAAAGLFYGGVTLVQMARPAWDGWEIPCASVSDHPRFEWRGLMLDEARHFLGKEYVLHLLDAMALHKMNRFLWHLTDDEGWRVEIKGYPRNINPQWLTENFPNPLTCKIYS